MMDKLFDFAAKSALPIKNYQEQWQQLYNLQQQCQSALPVSLAHAIDFVTLQAYDLIVLTSTAALASRLRLSQRQLLQAAQQHHPEIVRIIVRIRPPIMDEDTPLQLHREAPSTQTQHDLAILAQEIEDKCLKESLEHLLRVIDTRAEDK